MHRFLSSILVILIVAPAASYAQGAKSSCNAMDRACLIKHLEQTVSAIGGKTERDAAYRRLARTLTYEGDPDRAMTLIDKLSHHDAKAAMIGEIGMATGEATFTVNRQKAVFQKLSEAAKAIENKDARGEAYARIAAAQAFAGETGNAKSTLGQIEDGKLRDNTLAKMALMRAQRGDLQNTLSLLAAIQSQSYRNKAYETAFDLFLEKAQISEAYACANRIDNAYLRAKAIQRLLDRGNADKIDKEPDKDLLKALD